MGFLIQVLVEGINPRNPAEAMGRTSHNKLCFFPGEGLLLKGRMVMVHVDEVRAYSLFGKIVTQHAADASPSPTQERELVLA